MRRVNMSDVILDKEAQDFSGWLALPCALCNRQYRERVSG